MSLLRTDICPEAVQFAVEVPLDGNRINQCQSAIFHSDQLLLTPRLYVAEADIDDDEASNYDSAK